MGKLLWSYAQGLCQLYVAAGYVAFVALGSLPAIASDSSTCLGGFLPDLRTVVPYQIQLVNDHQREEIRLSNAIANFGDGPLELEPESALTDPTVLVGAFQNIYSSRDPSGTPVCSPAVTTFEFHPEHNHWHIGQVAVFEVRVAQDDGKGGHWGASL